LATLIALVLAVVLESEEERVRLADRSQAEALNLAGRQRMLSQRLALLAAPGKSAVARDALQEALSAMRSDAARLAALRSSWGGDLAALEEAERLRAALWAAVEQRSGREVGTPPELIHDAAGRVAAAAEAFLPKMELAVAALQHRIEIDHDQSSRARIRNLYCALAAFAAAIWVIGEFLAFRIRRDRARLLDQALDLGRLAIVARRTRNAVILTDAQGRVTWVNEAFIKLSGYDASETLGRTPGSLLQCEETDPKTRMQLRAAIRAGRPIEVNIVNRDKNGRLYWLNLDIQPLHAADGSLAGFSAVEVDITAEVTRRDEMHALFRALPVGVGLLDDQGLVTDANETAHILLGLAVGQNFEAELPKGLLKLQAEDGHELTGPQHPVAAAWRGVERKVDLVVVANTPDGRALNVRLGLINFAHPLTQARRLIVTAIEETAIRTQHTLLDLTVRNAGIGTWEWDLMNQHAVLAPHWWTMLGRPVSPHPVRQQEWLNYVHPEDAPRALQAVVQHLRQPEVPYRDEFRLRRADGSWIWVMATGRVTDRDPEGRARRMVGMHQDIADRKMFEGRLQDAALTDTLTGLPNRRHITQQIELRAAVADCAPPQLGASCGLLFLDFDRFKLVNDTLGHQAGDALLVQIAQRLRLALRGSDEVGRFDSKDEHGALGTAARMGGDEFVVLLPRLGRATEAECVARRLLAVLAHPYSIEGQEVRCAASIGVTTSEESGHDAAALLRDADIAMYEAKRLGRNQVVRFTASMRDIVAQAVDLERELRAALQEPGLLVNVYQPIVDLADRKVVGVEALVRWRHPTRGMICPDEFIAVAEQSGLIGPLGLCVLQQACRDFAHLRRSAGNVQLAYVAVNVSRAQLDGPIVDQVRQALSDHQLVPELLKLELTESLAMRPGHGAETLAELRNMGVGLAVDDFGTGYSSLGMLDKLPIDTLKIDRSFVEGVVASTARQALVRATLDVARALRLAVVAEGVESEAQAAVLLRLGCERAQGYLFSRPLAAEELLDFMRRQLPGRDEPLSVSVSVAEPPR
jgi:diguanylate cyclase (GGDEF)-like protein/PAS domain S-box-containing protein